MKSARSGDETLHPHFFTLNNKMEKIYNIDYVDAHYSYEPDLYTKEYYTHKEDLKVKSTSVHFFNAYGYVEKCGDDIVIAFIKKKGIPLRETIAGGKEIVDGLVIPESSLVSKANLYDRNILKEVKTSSRVAVIWHDPTYIRRLSGYDCSVMYTEGTLYKIEKDHIVLKDTETIRTYPMPVKNHPAGKPMWYIIPTSFIKDIEVISKKS